MEMRLAENRPDMEKVISYIKQAGELFTDRTMAGKILQKGSTDFVTMVDTQVQEYLQGTLRQHWPHIQFMGEEKDNSEINFDGSVWILDPVDGTTNLIHDFMHSTISLALAERGTVVQAVIYQPFTGEMFSAEAGRGAFFKRRTDSCERYAFPGIRPDFRRNCAPHEGEYGPDISGDAEHI